jgi:hypothetical protein
MESSDQHKTNSDIKERKCVWKETNWKKDWAKYLRSHGKKYIGEKKPAKLIKMYQHICRHKCNNFTEESRKEICSHFWNYGTCDL